MASHLDRITRGVEDLRIPAPDLSRNIDQVLPNRESNQNKLQTVQESGAVQGNVVTLSTSPTHSPAHSPSHSPTRPVAATPSLPREFYVKANLPKTKRLVSVCQMYFLEYYYDLFDYVINRRQRMVTVTDAIANLPPKELQVQWKSYCGRERAALRKRRVKPRHKDFELITKVGQGGYGEVYLARKSDTREICALKVLNKKLLMKLDETRHVLTERDILTNTRSDWLVKLLYAFQDQNNVYLAMEFVPGGDYRTLLNNTGVLVPPHARFYISEMFAAVSALHDLGYTHRDLKPENFLIDSKGHIKLTDFGLAAGSVSNEKIESMKLKLNAVKDLKVPTRSVKERQKLYRSMRMKDVQYANSIVGSPDYMALEVLQGKHYDYTIDYWSLGCMLFETLVGYPPFAGGSPEETYHNLRNWRTTLRRPQYEDGRFVFSDRTWQLISRLITTFQDRVKSFEEIKRFPYFADIDWVHVRERSPPFIPQLDDDEDAGYFDDFSNEKDMEKYKEVMDKKFQIENLADRNVPPHSFIGFTFKHKSGNNDLGDTNSFRHNPHRREDLFSTLY